MQMPTELFSSYRSVDVLQEPVLALLACMNVLVAILLGANCVVRNYSYFCVISAGNMCIHAVMLPLVVSQ
jgi:hypothetical protein